MHTERRSLRRPVHREELLPAEEVTASIDLAERRRRVDIARAHLDDAGLPALPPQADHAALRDRVTEFSRGRSAGLRDRPAQIRHNRISGGIVIGVGAMFLLAIPILFSRQADELGERRTWRAARDRAQ